MGLACTAVHPQLRVPCQSELHPHRQAHNASWREGGVFTAVFWWAIDLDARQLDEPASTPGVSEDGDPAHT